jgi:hypothetical protein
VAAHRAHAGVKVPLPVLTAAYEIAAQHASGDGPNGEPGVSPNGEVGQQQRPEPETLPES